MIWWRGLGFLAVLGGMVPALGAAGLAIALGYEPTGFFTVGALAAGAFCWIFGRKLNAPTSTATGQRVAVRYPHSLLSIPMQYWAFLWWILAVLAVIAALGR